MKKVGLKSVFKCAIIIYTAVFIILSGSLVTICVSSGHSLIYHSDAFRQHLRALRFFGEWMRAGFPGTWSFGLGYGADVITTLHYYCIADPLCLTAAFVPARYTFLLFQALIILRMYLSGLAFLYYCKVTGRRDSLSVVCGAVTYVFCGYTLYLGILHPFFVNAMIYLPFMLAGVFRIKEGKGPAVFILSVFVSAISNFYFFYMLALLTVLYTLWIRVPWKKIMFIALYAVTGVMMSMFILLPVILVFLSNPRSGVSFALPMFYESAYYKELPANLITVLNHPMYDTNLGYPVVFIPALAYVLIKGKNAGRYRVAALALTAFICLPFAGHVFNGFSYVINRFVFAVAFFAGCVVAEALGDAKKKSLRIAALTVASASAAFNIFMLYSPSKGNFVSELTASYDPVTYEAAQAAGEAKAVRDLTESEGSSVDFFRYSGRDLTWNESLSEGISSTQFCFSLANGVVSDLFRDLGVNEEQSFAYFGLDDRNILMSLASVRYYLLAYDNYYEELFPGAMYERKTSVGGMRTDTSMLPIPWDYAVYENPNAAKAFVAYDSIIAGDDWKKMTMTSREEAMLRGVYIEDGGHGLSFPTLSGLSFREKTCPYVTRLGDGISFNNGIIEVSDPGAELFLDFTGLPDSETYCCIRGLNYEGGAEIADINLAVFAEGEEIADKYLSYKTPKSQYYSDWHDFAVNLLYDPVRAKDCIRLRFDAAGTYTFDDLSVVCRPMVGITDEIKALTVSSSYDEAAIKLNDNNGAHTTKRIDASLKAGSGKILVFGIPFTRGWDAFVDGVRTDIHRANRMWSAVAVSEGDHDIVLTYRTPGLFAGMLLSIAGFIIFALITRHRNTAS